MYTVRTRIGMIIMSVLLLVGMCPTMAGFPAGAADGTVSAAGSNTVEYTVEWSSASAVNLKYQSSESAGRVYYMVKDAGSSMPGKQEMVSADQKFSDDDAAGSTSGSTDVSVSSSAAKDVYLMFQQYPESEKTYYDVTKISLPAYSSGFSAAGESSQAGSVGVKASRSSADSVALAVTPSVSGTLHYIVKGAGEAAPSASELLSAAGLSETADVTKTTDVSLGSDPTSAKKIYVLYTSTDGTKIGGIDSLDIPAYDQTAWAAKLSSDSVSFSGLTEGYDADGISKTLTVSNTGAGTLSFGVDETAEGYEEFSKYFTVDVSGAQNIGSGRDGSVSVQPKEGLEAGTYEGSFYLVDNISGDTSLKLGPVRVSMTVAEKSGGSEDGIREPEGKYTPGLEDITLLGNGDKIVIDGKVVYCVNYYFNLSTQSNTVMKKLYENEFGKLASVSAKELDKYTGLTTKNPVKNNAKDDKEKLANVRRVLYNGYGSDAAGIREKYDFKLLIGNRKDFAFEVATQCAIWYYTDTDENGNPLTFDQVKDHVSDIYKWEPVWGWKDVEAIYNILIGKDRSIQLKEPGADYEADLYVANNPVNGTWTQNLIGGTSRTSDVSVTKAWDDESGADGNRPSASAFKKWLRLYCDGEDVTDEHEGRLTVKDNGNNTYTVTWTGLPGSADKYTVKEEIPEMYRDVYKISGTDEAANGGTIKNSETALERTEITVKKVWKDGSDAENLRPSQSDFAKWVKLYANGVEEKDAAAVVSGEGDTWTVTFSGLRKYDDSHKLISYSVKEEIPESCKYAADYGSGSGSAADGGTIANTLTDTTSLKVNKSWKNNSGDSIDAPENAKVTFTLLANGEDAGANITLDGDADQNGESGSWTAEWKDLPKYDTNGEKITYSVYESSGQDGYVGDHTSKDQALVLSSDDLSITNTKIGSAYVDLSASKTMTGASLSGDDFSFTLKDDDGNTIETKKNDENGNISFSRIDYNYSDAGKHVYYIAETAGTDGSITYDGSVYRVTVTVKADGTKLTATPVYEKSIDGGSTWTTVTNAIFSNVKGEAAKWQLKAKKTTSDNSKFRNGEFVFGLFDASGNMYYLKSDGTLTLSENGNIPMTATNDEAGNVVFPEVTTETESSSKYYIKEIGCADDADSAEWNCDTVSAHEADVTVGKDSSGNLKAEVKYAAGDIPEISNSRRNVSLRIMKAWNGISAENRPDSVEFRIQRIAGENGTPEDVKSVVLSKPVNDTGVWTVMEKDLPAVDGNGTEYIYSVSEVSDGTHHFDVKISTDADTVENGEVVKNFKVTNSPDSAKINIPVEKKWAEGVSGESATVVLKQDGREIDSIDLTANNKWKHTFEDLDKYANDGHEYEYTVEETNKNYKATVEKSGDGYVITNDKSDEKISIPVEKKWAEGVTGESATVILKQDGEKIGSIDLTAENNWKHTFGNLDKYANDGHEYEYTVEETNSNYHPVIVRNSDTDITKGFTVTNEQSDEKVSIPVEKKWADGASGEEAVIVLVKNGEKTDQKLVLTEENSWKGSFDDLDKYDKDGRVIEYSVTEETSEFSYEVKEDGNGGFIVTNYPEETPVTTPNDSPNSPEDSGGESSGNDSPVTDSPVTVVSDAPQTGDDFDMSLFALTAGGAALAAGIALAASRKRRREQAQDNK